jgi:hypothetical protein
MSPHRTPRRRPSTFASLIALTATLVAASLGLAACGGSSSTTTTTTQTAANAAATGTTTGSTSTSGTTSTGTSSTGTTSTGTSTTGTPAEPSAATRYAATRTCLSKKGITLPQRSTGAGGFLGGASGAQLPKGMSRAQFAEALHSCGAGFNGNHFGKRGKGFKNPFNNPRFHAVLVRFAACLRQNGINIGEPNTSGKGPIFDTKGINTGSTQFKAAEAKCRSTLLYALRPNHASPGASGTTTTG